MCRPSTCSSREPRRSSPDFVLTRDNVGAVAEICRRLDGLPLAIELAAAWTRLLSPQVLLTRLEQRLPMLTGGGRDLPSRQKTIRDSIAWSYDLLTQDEQHLFRRLAVFVGGFTLDAAEAVAGDGHGQDVLDGLAGLMESSLLRRYEERNRRSTLRHAGDGAGVRAGAAGRERGGGGDPGPARGLVPRPGRAVPGGGGSLGWRIWAGCRALRRSTTTCEQPWPGWSAPGTWTRLLRLAGATQPFWDVRGHRAEAVAWLERALALRRGRTAAGAPPRLGRAWAKPPSARLLRAGKGHARGTACAGPRAQRRGMGGRRAELSRPGGTQPGAIRRGDAPD